jgi:hypothetical protein
MLNFILFSSFVLSCSLSCSSLSGLYIPGVGKVFREIEKNFSDFKGAVSKEQRGLQAGGGITI